MDYFKAVNLLIDLVHLYNTDDYENLLRALKDGSCNGTRCSKEDIAALKNTKHFRQRHS